MFVNKLFVCLKFLDVKSSRYYFHMKTKILADFKSTLVYL